MAAKTIQIFLPDGNARSIRIADITSRMVQAVSIPRAKMQEAGERAEVKKVGVYFLFGESEEDAKPQVYIGEAEDCYSRLKGHNKTKDFWNVAICVTSKTDHLTKAHGKFLEWYCWSKAKQIGRYEVVNGNEPTKSSVPEAVEADLLDNFEAIRILVSTLGYPVLEEVQHVNKADLLYCEAKGAKAKGEYTDDGMVVFAGGTAVPEITKSAQRWLVPRREKLFASGVLVEDGSLLKFTQDYVFTSPSAAADMVQGRSANGWTEWKNKDGKTLDELKRK